MTRTERINNGPFALQRIRQPPQRKANAGGPQKYKAK